MTIKVAVVAASLAAPAAVLAADDVPPPIIVNALLADRIDSIAGSVTILDGAAIERMQPVTLKDVLRRAPGVHVVDEDAAGLRLNISVRGLNPRRSARTLLLEDGAPIQPAPYADPSAQYTPQIERIERIELRKGSGQILFGPQSIGGMINFITRAPPTSPELTARLAGGERSFLAAHASLGTGGDRGGIRIDLTRKRASGTRDFHNSSVRDAAVLGRLSIGASHIVRAKAAYFTERSRITEAGLDAARYAINPYGNPFRNDRFVLTRTSAQVIDEWTITPWATLTTQAYFANTARASYRQTDESNDVMTANPATGCVGAARIDYEGFAARCGNKMRPRTFTFWGIEPRLELRHGWFGRDSRVIIGARYHDEDTIRRRFNGLTPDAREVSHGTVLRDYNQIDTNAASGYVENLFVVGAVSLTQGLRIERIMATNTSLVANFITTGVASKTAQTITLPGAGVTWQSSNSVTLFGGIHRGFAPPRPDRDIDPIAPFSPVRAERSVEIEIGVRARPGPGFSFEATLFALSVSDLIVEGPLVGGRSGTFVNAGSARHRGFEASGQFERGSWHVSANYSWLLTAKFTSDVDEADASVRGNRLPYAPRHMIGAAFGYDGAHGAGFEFGLNHVSAQFSTSNNLRTPSADGLSGIIPARTIFRAAVHYQEPESRFRWFATVENLFDRVFIASRIDGLFAGPRRQAVGGLSVGF